MTTLRSAFATSVQDLVMLAARFVLGAVFLAHGWQKFEDGLPSVTDWFTQLGIPFAPYAAIAVIVAEILGGIALVLGLLTRIAALALIVDMAGAVWFVHWQLVPFVDNGGWELEAALGVGALILFAFGAGRLSMDYPIVRGIRNRRDAKREVSDLDVVEEQPENVKLNA